MAANRRSSYMQDRAHQIAQMVLVDNLSLSAVAQRCEVSRERVHQIVRRFARETLRAPDSVREMAHLRMWVAEHRTHRGRLMTLAQLLAIEPDSLTDTR